MAKNQLDMQLQGVVGVGTSMANAIISILNLDPNKQLGALSDADVKRIEEFLQDPLKFKIPQWMINRRNDWASGKDIHLVSSELKFTKDRDIGRLKLIRARRGMRHALGLKLRGQRTKSTGRKGKTVGVSRKAAKAKKTK